MIESLFRRLHEVYMVEAKRQGDVRHNESYDELAENIKDFDRALVQFILNSMIPADAPKYVQTAWNEVKRYLESEEE
jgi:hypothetical protein